MLDFTNCNLGKVIVHQVGNKTNDEDIVLSKSLLETNDSRLRELLIKYFLYSFSNTEFYSFSFSNEDFKLNPLYQFATSIFSNQNDFEDVSKSIAKHLYEISLHPQIKSGDLFLSSFSNIEINGKLVNGFGIFKSENRQPFLKLNKKSNDFVLNYEDGINIDKLDKGCLVLDLDKENGYQVCVIDKSSKSVETQYWKDRFLNVKPAKDDYHQTNQFLSITKQFVTKQLAEDSEVTKTDQIDFLNRSVGYFKTHDTFNKQEFEKEVFADGNIIESFRKFDQSYRQENNVELSDDFEISAQAVKKQARIFKSVLKLDKNFHIYIHGNRELIEQGIDENGRKYYKIYYEEES
ncbi:MAG: nucleoid-associated protein [Bacteroidales bacterium]|nr:nucleoid-associated protein [Bacteroidales bacterium]